jgi:hypothetical protein
VKRPDVPGAAASQTFVVRFASDAAGALRGRVTEVATNRTRSLRDPQSVREYLHVSGFARSIVVRFDVDEAGIVSARAIDPATRRASPVARAPSLLALLRGSNSSES